MGVVTPPPRIDVEHRTLRGRPRVVLRRILLTLARVVIGIRLKHVGRVPKEGAVLMVANHLHNADPLLISIAFPRPIHFMSKKEAFQVPVLPHILRMAGVFPVDRGRADRTAIRRALLVLEQGVAVGMFAEGTRSPTRSLQRAQPGAGMIALTAGVPIMPIAITGTERLPLNGAKGKASAGEPMPEPGHDGVRVLFGETFTIPREIDGRRVTATEATEIIMVEIARLLPPDYRGVYADLLDAELLRRAR